MGHNQVMATSPTSPAFHDKPMAGPGLVSYRYQGAYGWIMIGATDHAQALREAQRSTSLPVSEDKLQIWAGSAYQPVQADGPHLPL